MFTGIVKRLGTIKSVRRQPSFLTVRIDVGTLASSAKVGDSFSVNGTCLTVTDKAGKCLNFDIVSETLKKTNLGTLKPLRKVNIEPAMKLSDRLHGHFVSGHIDASIPAKFSKKKKELVLKMEIPKKFQYYVVEKGSIAVDGISLTVAKYKNRFLEIHIIPETLKSTNLKLKKDNDLYNIEFDLLGKYIINSI